MLPAPARTTRGSVTDVRQQLQAALGDAYTIERELGGGGMAHVFVAFDRQLQRRVVVKVLPPGVTATLSVERFEREIMMAAAMQHPNIVPVLTSGDASGLPYFVMPFVEGESLRESVRRGPMPIRDVVRIMRDVVRALAFAHARGIVHRDIKPDNVLLSSGAATVTDFGVAKALVSARTPSRFHEHGTLTGQGTSLGTPAYMAPEQAAGDPDTDHRADIYAFGIVAYEMLTGKPPFHGRPPQQLLAAHLAEAPVPVQRKRKDCPDALAAIVMGCLEKGADARPQSAEALASLLDDPAVVSGTFSTASRDAMRAAQPWRRGPFVFGAAAAIGVTALLGVLLMRPRDPGPVAAPAVAAAPVNENSLAVLPLIAIGPDGSDQYLAEGITAELTRALSLLPGFRVASRMAASNVRSKGGDIATVGKDLNVAYVLEGTVQRDGKRLRLTARLVHVSDGITRWSDVFERQSSDAFKVQDDLTKAIASALEDELVQAEKPAAGVHAPPAVGPVGAAYNDYLRGRFFQQKRTEPALAQAATLFRRAVGTDPKFALAWAGLADTYAMLTVYSTTPNDSLIGAGLKAADRAIALDSALPEGYAARGNLRALRADFRNAEQDLARAVALAPQNATAQQYYGEFLVRTRRAPEALAHLKLAAELDPTSPTAASSYGVALGITGQRKEALARASESVELDPSLPFTRVVRARMLRDAGSATEGVKELETALALSSGAVHVRGMLGNAYAREGQVEKAKSELAKLEAMKERPGTAGAIAMVYLGLNDTARAMDWLLKAADRKDVMFRLHELGPKDLAIVRGDRRFGELAVRLGLPSMPGGPGQPQALLPKPASPTAPRAGVAPAAPAAKVAPE